MTYGTRLDPRLVLRQHKGATAARVDSCCQNVVGCRLLRVCVRASAQACVRWMECGGGGISLSLDATALLCPWG